MDTKKLRQKILDLAIRGKLVPQDPNDEPASVLLERIRAEKEQLIKEGKIKRSKKSAASDTSHYENVPFEVPESWCWTTIEDLLINRDSERIPLSLAVRNKQHKKEYNYYGAAGVIDKVEGYLFSERLLLIGEDGANLLSRAKDNAFFADGKYWVNNHAHVLDCSEKEVLTYVALVINSMALDPYVTGSAQPKLSQDNLNKILIPLPPLAEQRRIIYAINNYSVYLSNIENDKKSIENIIDLLKQLILNLAITGKLVSQELNDEPAIELLKRIYPSFVPADNRHYRQLPDSWQVVKIKDVFTINPKNKVDDDIDAGFVSMSMIDDGYRDSYQFEKKKWSLIKSGFTHFQDGDIAVAKISPCLENRKSMILKKLPNSIGAGTTELHIFRSSIVDSKFALYFFKSDYFINQCIGTFNGAVGQQRVRKNTIEDIEFPLPPYEEQKRISEKITHIFECLDKITAEL